MADDWQTGTETLSADEQMFVDCSWCPWSATLSPGNAGTVHRCGCGDRYRLRDTDDGYRLQLLPYVDSDERRIREEFLDAEMRVFRGHVHQWQAGRADPDTLQAEVVGHWQGIPIQLYCWLPACEGLIDEIVDREGPTWVWVVFRPFWSSTTPDDRGVWSVDAEETIAVHADTLEDDDGG